MTGILRRARNRKVLVIGDVGVDRYVVGAVERISPEAPVPIVAVQEENYKLGLAANVAENVRVLGGIPILLGFVGRDRTAQEFRRLLKRARISDVHLVVDGGRRTSLKERVVSDRQQLLRVDYETLTRASAGAEKQFLGKVRKLLKQVDIAILEDYAKGLLSKELAAGIFQSCGESGIPVLVDMNRKTPLEYYRGATLLKPNMKEAEYLSGIKIVDEKSLIAASRKILNITNAKTIVVTLGKEGMAVYDRGRDNLVRIPTYAREVYDVTGAGDTVISILALALAAGAPLREACVLANFGAGVVVGKRGTATVTLAEIDEFMKFYRGKKSSQ